MNTGEEKATEGDWQASDTGLVDSHPRGSLSSQLTLKSSTQTLIFEHHMVSDYTHPGQIGNVITNTRIVIKEETVHHSCASLHKTLVYTHDARYVCAGSEGGHPPGPAKAAYFLDRAV